MQGYVCSLFVHFCRYYLFFVSRARSTPGESGTGTYRPRISLRISPLHEFWIAGLDSSIRLGQKSSTKGNTSRSR